MKSIYLSAVVFWSLGIASGATPHLSGKATKIAYAPNKPILIQLTLTNTGKSATSIGTLPYGTIRMRSLTRNGQRVPSRTVLARGSDDLTFLLQNNQKILQPGGSAEFRLQTIPDPVLGGQSLAMVHFDPAGRHTVTYSLVGTPGTYRLSLFYQYPFSRAVSKISRQPTNNVEIVFTVMPR